MYKCRPTKVRYHPLERKEDKYRTFFWFLGAICLVGVLFPIETHAKGPQLSQSVRWSWRQSLLNWILQIDGNL